ncbi:hypothetical protein GCM10009623_10170 [Nocardioides aestuarii]|uniref:YcnI family protein n=1 Tax=Nocardioides aestuarii TaxID=252231 RepID=A0ABW4THR7_9ACTN
MNTRTLTRLGAPTAALALVALAASPAAAHVTGTPTTTAAGAFTVVTFSVGHGCEGSPTTGIEIQVPEGVNAVTPTRNPLYELEKNIEQLDEPITDTHGNEVTERVASVTYTADTALPDGQRDTFELSFQIPEDAEGETLAFPTIQTCERGKTGWTQIPEDGQDAEELDTPAPSFVVTAAEGDGHGHGAEESSDEPTEATVEEPSTGMVGWAGLVLGGLGLVAGGTALARSRTRA